MSEANDSDACFLSIIIDLQLNYRIFGRHKKTRLPIGKRVRTHYENTLKTYQEFKFVVAALCFRLTAKQI